MPWRTQATWTTEDGPRSYAPIFTRTRWGALRARRRIEDTLWSFPTLGVRVERVSSASMRAEQAERAAAPPAPVVIHLMLDPERMATACGRDGGEVTWTADEFEEGVERCPDCEAAVRLARRGR
jgi:hypothetical protein